MGSLRLSADSLGRLPFNTTGPSLESAAKLEKYLLERVRCFQLLYWFSHKECFQIFGTLRQGFRSGNVSLDTLQEYIPEPSSSSRPVAQRSVAAVEPEEVPSAAESEVFSELYSPSL